ncbi:MAG TPA: uracil-DNA glycosylase [Candidatus Binataceae bacterium]|nr:uracil-DNA glycosylase [Candidatus Binataceae bacterium]
MNELQSRMLACARCSALVRCRSRVVPGAGPVGAAVAFVGIAPGRFGGDRTGVPFSGDRSGRLLREMIAAAGLREVFITNLVRCNPRDARGRNRDPRPAEIANCRRHLEAELALVKPKIIACLGRMAWLHLAGKEAPFDPAGASAVRTPGWLLYPMYHPAYVNRGAYPVRSYVRDFIRLRVATLALDLRTPRTGRRKAGRSSKSSF